MATMVFVNSVNYFSTMPWWSCHAVNWGLTYVDLVEPCFIFAIGLTYHMNLMSPERKKNGGLQANLRFLKRFWLCGFGISGLDRDKHDNRWRMADKCEWSNGSTL